MSDSFASLRTLALNALYSTELKKTILSNHLVPRENIWFSLCWGIEDFRKVMSLRKQVFVKEEGYPSYAVCNRFDRYGFHFLAWKESTPIGTITVYLNTEKGLPLIKKYGVKLEAIPGNLRQLAEIQKLAVLPSYRLTMVSMGLMVVAYEFIRLCGAKKIAVFTLQEKKNNISLYEKFGFSPVADFTVFNNTKARCFLLDIAKDSPYESLRKVRKNLLLRHLAKILFIQPGPGNGKV